MVRIRLQVTYLLDGMQYTEFLAWREATDGMLSDEFANAFIEDYVSQFPPILHVDREVWHSLDRHSFDTHELTWTVDPCIVDDYQLERLPDIETVKQALADILRDGRKIEIGIRKLA